MEVTFLLVNLLKVWSSVCVVLGFFFVLKLLIEILLQNIKSSEIMWGVCSPQYLTLSAAGGVMKKPSST